MYSSRQFLADLRTTITMAAFYAILAAIGFGLLGVLVLTGKPLAGASVATIGTVGGAFGVFVLVYFVAASGSAVAVFLLRPLRRSRLGWAATGGLVSLICYSTLLGLTHIFRSTLGWLYALRGVSDTGSDGYWSFLMILLAVVFVPMGAVFGVYWRDNPPGETH
jgi:hypothetical protein